MISSNNSSFNDLVSEVTNLCVCKGPFLPKLWSIFIFPLIRLGGLAVWETGVLALPGRAWFLAFV